MFSMKGFEKEADPNLELVDCWHIDAGETNMYLYVRFY